MLRCVTTRVTGECTRSSSEGKDCPDVQGCEARLCYSAFKWSDNLAYYRSTKFQCMEIWIKRDDLSESRGPRSLPNQSSHSWPSFNLQLPFLWLLKVTKDRHVHHIESQTRIPMGKQRVFETHLQLYDSAVALL